MRVARLACTIFIAVLLFAAPAGAQAPAVNQYANPGTSTAPKSGTLGETVAGTQTGDATPSSGTQAPTGSASPGSNAAPPTLRIAFGSAAVKLDSAIDDALRQGGILPGSVGEVMSKDIKRFLASPLARQLSSGDAEHVGRAVGRLIVDPGPLTAPVLQELLGYAPALGDATNAVFTRSHVVHGQASAFERGVVKGSDDVPRAYVEMSGAKHSFVKAFDKLGVSTVDNIETPAGKAALVAILVSGANGNFGAKSTADAKLVAGEVRPLAATVGESGGAPLSYLLLALVAVAMLAAAGVRPRRGRRA